MSLRSYGTASDHHLNWNQRTCSLHHAFRSCHHPQSSLCIASSSCFYFGICQTGNNDSSQRGNIFGGVVCARCVCIREILVFLASTLVPSLVMMTLKTLFLPVLPLIFLSPISSPHADIPTLLPQMVQGRKRSSSWIFLFLVEQGQPQIRKSRPRVKCAPFRTGGHLFLGGHCECIERQQRYDR